MKQLLESKLVWLVLVIPILVGFSFLWTGMDLRVLHHDESLNAIYGLYYYLDPTKQFYKYDPMLHGPLLYHILPWIYHLFDESIASLRIIPTVLFSLIPLGIGLLFKKELGIKVLIPVALLLTGPSYQFWGNFLRHDQLVLALMVISAIAFLPKLKKARPYIFCIAISLQFCTKENSYVHLALLLGFIVFDYLILRKDLFILSNLLKYKAHLVFSVLISFFIYCFYYSAGFNYLEGIVDGLYRKSLFYWANQHAVERISGPFLTQFFVLLWYELPVVALLFFSTIHLHWKRGGFLRFLPIAVLVISFFFHLIYWKGISTASSWDSLFKLKLAIDFYGFFYLLILSVSGTWILLTQKGRLLAFSYYWFMASFFTYSFLGEKVPWLSIYILISGVIFLSLYLKDFNAKILAPILIVSLIYNTYQAYELNFSNSGSKDEFISQVHTTKEYQDISFQLQHHLESNKGINVLAYKGNTWPLTWFLYKRIGYHYHHSGNDFEKYNVVLDNFPSKLKLLEFKRKKVELRHWWVPRWESLTPYKLFKYSFDHKPWNKPGSQKVTVFYKNELLNF